MGNDRGKNTRSILQEIIYLYGISELTAVEGMDILKNAEIISHWHRRDYQSPKDLVKDRWDLLANIGRLESSLCAWCAEGRQRTRLTTAKCIALFLASLLCLAQTFDCEHKPATTWQKWRYKKDCRKKANEPKDEEHIASRDSHIHFSPPSSSSSLSSTLSC